MFVEEPNGNSRKKYRYIDLMYMYTPCTYIYIYNYL